MTLVYVRIKKVEDDLKEITNSGGIKTGQGKIQKRGERGQEHEKNPRRVRPKTDTVIFGTILLGSLFAWYVQTGQTFLSFPYVVKVTIKETTTRLPYILN